MSCDIQNASSACRYLPAAQKKYGAEKTIKAQAAQNYPVYRDFPSATEAVEYLIKEFDPQVLGFGEFHKESDSEYTSTSEHFAEEIIPVLAENGFLDLILEFIPNDPKVVAEIELYKKSGVLSPDKTPTLIKWLGVFDAKGIEKIYEKALGLDLHGGHLSLKEFQLKELGKLKKDPKVIIKNTILKEAKELLKKGKKVAVYGGLSHNDTQKKGKNAPISIGKELSKACKYIEIDLIIPEIFDECTGDFAEKKLYSSLIPEKGVLLIRTSENKFVMLFSRSLNNGSN